MKSSDSGDFLDQEIVSFVNGVLKIKPTIKTVGSLTHKGYLRMSPVWRGKHYYSFFQIDASVIIPE